MIGNFIGSPIGGVINYGGTLYTQAVSASGSGAVALTRSVGKGISPVSTGTVTIARAIAHALGISGSSTVTPKKAITHLGPAISGTGTAAVTFTKTILQAVTIVTTGLVGLIVHAGRVVMIHLTSMGTVSFGPKQISKTVAWAATGTVTIVKMVFKTLSLALSGAIEFGFAFFRFITKPNSIGKQITSTMARNATITADPASTAQITTSPEDATDITSSGALPRNITT